MKSSSSTEAVTQRADALRNHRAILDAALVVLGRDPSAAMVDVAARSGLTRATLYRHFPSRQALLAALRDEAFSWAGTALSRCHLDQGSAPEALTRAVQALLPLGLRFRVLLQEGAEQDTAFLERRAAVFAAMEQVVRRGQAAGEIRADMPAEWVVAVLSSMLVNTVRLVAAGAVRRADAADLVCRALFEGMAVTSRPGRA